MATLTVLAMLLLSSATEQVALDKELRREIVELMASHLLWIQETAQLAKEVSVCEKRIAAIREAGQLLATSPAAADQKAQIKLLKELEGFKAKFNALELWGQKLNKRGAELQLRQKELERKIQNHQRARRVAGGPFSIA